LAQPDAFLWPAFHRRFVGGLGQREVLDSRQLVGDLAIAVNKLNACLKKVRTKKRSLEQSENRTVLARTVLV
jgi:hypothetical protein